MDVQCSRSLARAACALALLARSATGLAADPPIDPEGLLQRIRSKVVARLSQLPNYTCRETIDRYLRRPSAELRPIDRVELEVAFVGNREMYAPPGGEFEDGHASRLVHSGTISDGEYGTHMVSLFRTDHASFQFAGTGKKDGHRTYQYDFRMPQEKSNFLLKHDAAEGIVGYRGSFWVDTATLDLVRLEIKAEHIPAYIGIDSVSETMRYEMIQAGGAEFLLPQTSELAVWFEGGNYSLNIVRLERCREYTGESSVAFGAVQGSSDRQKTDPGAAEKK
jgi:hypothetical protein